MITKCSPSSMHGCLVSCPLGTYVELIVRLECGAVLVFTFSTSGTLQKLQ